MSAMFRASFSVAIRPRTFKSSMPITENTWHQPGGCLVQPVLPDVGDACKRASRMADLRLLLLPFFFRLRHLESLWKLKPEAHQPVAVLDNDDL